MSKPLYKQSSAIGRDAGARSLERFVNNRSRGKAERLGEGIYNVIVIGAGTAGLVTAAGTADLGGRVALIERNKMGGDCLNYGCVPSKALISSARLVQQIRNATNWGLLVSRDGKAPPRLLFLRVGGGLSSEHPIGGKNATRKGYQDRAGNRE